MNRLTGAHLTLPLSSKVMVRNPHNGKEVVITVNDRGPYIKNRVIDLSHEAAKQLGILSCGIAYVNYTVLAPETQSDSGSSSRRSPTIKQAHGVQELGFTHPKALAQTSYNHPAELSM